MKTILQKLFFVTLTLLCVTNATAHDFEVDGIYYAIISSTNKTVLVTFNGNSSSYSDEYRGNVVIPKNVTYNNETYNITSIGSYAFDGCTSLTSVTIPGSVNSIGHEAFNGCTGLTSITIPNSVKTIDYDAFRGCSGLTSVTIGNSVTSIGNYAFSGCSGLTSITIPNSVTSIGGGAFRDCTGLTSVTIPNSVTSIGGLAFYNCNELTSVTIGNGITCIEDKAFDRCSSLKEVNISDIATWCNIEFNSASSNPLSFAKNLFLDGKLITDLIIPDGVTSIGSYAFDGCTSLTSVTIPNSVTNIGNYAFYNCTRFTSVTIGNSVTSIGDYAFSGCRGLTNVTIPNSVTSIGESAFRNCTGLTNVTIPNSVTSIGKSAFQNCTGLTNVTIPNSVTSIGNYAFEDCTGLKEVHINDIAAWCGIDFGNTDSNPLRYAHNLYLNGELVTELVVPNGVNEIKWYAFYSCTGLTSVTIGNSVTSIGESAFEDCTGLTTITIPNSVTSIGESAFDNTTWYNNQANGVVYAGKVLYKYKGTMSGSTLIVIKDGTLRIASRAFQSCTGLTSIIIPNSVTSIGDYAFLRCTGLTSITIPNSVNSIGYEAFSDCTGLKTVVNFSNLTFTKGSSGDGYIAYYANNVYNAPNGSIEEDCVFCKPNEVNTLVGYLGSAMELTLPGNYKGEDYIIGAYALRGCSGLTSITIPNSVTSIGNYAFEDCTNLTNVTIGNSVTSIGRWAFQSCTGLKEVHISDLAAWCGIDFENVLSNPLYYAHNLYLNGELVTELVIPDGVNEIKQYAFRDCTGLTSVTIPNSVTSIGENAFDNTTWYNNQADGVVYADKVLYKYKGSMPTDTNIQIKDGTQSIAAEAFENCTGLTSITIPNSEQGLENVHSMVAQGLKRYI